MPPRSVLWVRDPKTKQKWFMSRDLYPTVALLREACESDPRYHSCPDRTPGFLTLFFGHTKLSVDSALFGDLSYPEYSPRQFFRRLYIDITKSPVKGFHLTSPAHDISFTYSCHARTLVRGLKSRLALDCDVSPRAIRLCHGNLDLANAVKLHRLPSHSLTFSIAGYTRLLVTNGADCQPFFIESSRTVSDFVSFIQAKRFAENPAHRLQEISVLDGERPLPDAAVIRDIFPSERGSVTLKFTRSFSPALVTLSFRFPSGPPYNLSLPSDSRMGFARAIISRVRSIALSELEFEPSFDPSMTINDFVSAHPAVLFVRSATIKVTIYQVRGTDIVTEFPAIPLTDRVFDLKTRLLELFVGAPVHHCELYLMARHLRLPDTQELSRYACDNTLSLRLAVIGVKV
jgi:hypothetical protein